MRRDAVGDFKPALTDAAVIEHLSPIQARYAEIIEEEGYLDGVLKRGADARNEVAEKTVADVRDAMEFHGEGVRCVCSMVL